MEWDMTKSSQRANNGEEEIVLSKRHPPGIDGTVRSVRGEYQKTSAVIRWRCKQHDWHARWLLPLFLLLSTTSFAMRVVSKYNETRGMLLLKL